MDYYLAIAIRDLKREKFNDLVETVDKFSCRVEQTEKDLILSHTDDLNMLSCLFQMRENYPDAHYGFSQYLGIAKGLAKIAKVTEILISEEIEKKVIENFEITSLGMLSIEGMSSQILVYRIDASTKKLQFPKLKPQGLSIPRRNEIASLQNLLRVSKVILITNPPGSGTTTFLDQVVEQWQDKEIFRTTCTSYGMGLTLKPVNNIAAQILGIANLRRIEEKQKTIEHRLKELDIADIGTSYLALLDFLGLGEEESIFEKLELTMRVDVITSTIADIIKRISWTKPVVIIIEDVENMDASSVNFIQHLKDKLIEEDICFILSSTLPQINISGLKEFELRDIEKAQLISMVQEVTGDEMALPPTTPFHVAQYLCLYREEMMSYLYRQYCGQTTITEYGLSFYDIKTIIKRRLELLDEKKEFILRLAVAGVELDPDELPLDEKEHYLFNYFVKQNYLKHYFNHYMFVNPLLQQEIYNLVLDKEKQHQRLADYYCRIAGFEEQATYHYREAKNYKKAIEFMIKSGDSAIKRGGYEAGIQYYHQTLELCQRQKESVNLELLVTLNEALADIYRALGDEQNALKYYKVVLDSYKEILKE
jgi:hypothetical protein